MQMDKSSQVYRSCASYNYPASRLAAVLTST